MFVIEKFKELEKQNMDSQNTVLMKLGEFEKLIDPLKDLSKDVEVFARIKHFVTVDAMTMAMEDRTKATYKDLNSLKTNIEEFATRVDGCFAHNTMTTERLENIERAFQVHVAEKFSVVEREYSRIVGIIDGVAQNQQGKAENTLITGKVHHLEHLVNAVTEKTQLNEGHINKLFMEHGVMQGQFVQFKGHLQELAEKTAAAAAGAAGACPQPLGPRGEGPGVQAPTSAGTATGGSSEPCHGRGADHGDRITAVEVWLRGCRLEEFKNRVEKLEQHRGDPWQGAPRPQTAPPGDFGGAPSPVAPRAQGPGAFAEAPRPQPWPSAQRPGTRQRVARAAYPDLVGVNMHKLFDGKIALASDYQYAGGDDGQRWKRKVRGYWIAKCPELLPVLDWAEERDDKEITHEVIKYEAEDYKWMIEVDVRRLSEVIWGFLGTCLVGEAHTIFEGAEELNGFEAWRLITQHVSSGQNVRLANLRKLVKNPPQIRRLEDVVTGITKFDNILKDYVAAGGNAPKDLELKDDLLNSLPQEIRENLLWRAVGPEDYQAFKNHVRSTTTSVLYHRGKLDGGINSVDKAPKPPGPTGEGGPEVPGESWEERVLAVIHKTFKGKGKGKGKGKDGDGAGKGGAVRDPWKCNNCGSEKHSIRDCPRPLVPMEERPCHGCGKKGHVRSKCPQRRDSRRPVKALDEEDEDEVPWIGCVMHKSRSRERHDQGKPRPMPRTLAAFMPTPTRNGFEALTEDDEDVDASKTPRAVTARAPKGQRCRVSEEGVPGETSCGSSCGLPFKGEVGTEALAEKIEDNIDVDHNIQDSEWEAMKSGSKEYRMFRERQEQKEQDRRRGKDKGKDEDKIRYTRVTCQQRCHACGWTGVPARAQSCPECWARDSMSIHDHLRQQGVRGGMGLPAEEAHPAETPVSREASRPQTAAPGDFGGAPSPEAPRAQGPGVRLAKLEVGAAGPGASAPGAQEEEEARGMKAEEISRIIEEKRKRGTRRKNEPNTLKKTCTDENTLAPVLEYETSEGEDSSDEGEILAAGEVVEVEVAADTGAVAHVVGPKDLPKSLRVVKPKGKVRNFVGPKGETIDNYGTAEVEMEQEDGRILGGCFNVADVCRPLHSISTITDQAHDMLFMRNKAVVVPEGTFDKILAMIKPIITYPRKGGLYVAKMKITDPSQRGKSQRSKSQRGKRRDAGFAGQVQGR